jgi:hypothetical protein
MGDFERAGGDGAGDLARDLTGDFALFESESDATTFVAGLGRREGGKRGMFPKSLL